MIEWIGRGVAAVVAIAVLGAGVAYAASEWIIRQHYDAPYPSIAADRSITGIAEGGRLTRIFFCQGCHGDHGEGEVIEDLPGAKAVAPAFAAIAASHSDAEIARAIRYGVGKDGHQMYVMPVQLVGKLADTDIAKMIGWIRSVRPGTKDMNHGGVAWTLAARYALLTGKLDGKARMQVDAPKVRPADAGMYYANASCQQCHRLHVANSLGDQIAPPLAPVAASYDRAAFHRLLKTGIGLTPGDLGWMTWAAKGHLHYLTDTEIDQIQTALQHEQAAHPAQ